MEDMELLNIPSHDFMMHKEVHGDFVVYQQQRNEIAAYSISQKRIQYSLHYDNETVHSYVVLGENYLISVSRSFLRAWGLSDGTMLCTVGNHLKVFGMLRSYGGDKFVLVDSDDVKLFHLKKSDKSKQFELIELKHKYFENIIINSSSQVVKDKIALLPTQKKKVIIFNLINFETIKRIKLRKVYFLDSVCMNNENLVYCHVPHRSKNKQIISVYDAKTFKDKPITSTTQHHVSLDEEEFRQDVNKLISHDDQIGVSEFKLTTSVSGSVIYDRSVRCVKTEHNKNYAQERIVMLSLQTGEKFLDYKFPITTSAPESAYFSLGNYENIPQRMIVLNKENKYGIVSTPVQVLEKAGIGAVQSIGILKDDNPLKEAYIACCNNEKSPSGLCNGFITADMCQKSITEFHCAHRILILAIKSNQVTQHQHSLEENMKWYNSIYTACRHLNIITRKDRKLLEAILIEAKYFKVIDSIDAYLIGHDITQQFNNEHSEILRFGMELFERIVNLEYAHLGLKQAFERYVHMQGITTSIGIALNLLPFIGGAAASAISVGAELYEKIAIGDLTELGIQTGIDVLSNTASFEDGLFKLAGHSLNNQQLMKMKEQQRNKLLSHIDQCGTTAEVLQVLLINASNGKYKSIKEIEQGLNESSNLNSSTSENVYSKVLAEEVDEETEEHEGDNLSDTLSSKSHSEDELNVETMSQVLGVESFNNLVRTESSKPGPSTVKGTEFSNNPNNPPMNVVTEEAIPDIFKDISKMASWKLQQFGEYEITRDTIEELDFVQCSYVMSSFIINYADANSEVFHQIQSCLEKLFQKEFINGQILTNMGTYDTNTDELSKLIYDGMKNHSELNVNKFVMIRICLFLQKLE